MTFTENENAVLAHILQVFRNFLTFSNAIWTTVHTSFVKLRGDKRESEIICLLYLRLSYRDSHTSTRVFFRRKNNCTEDKYNEMKTRHQGPSVSLGVRITTRRMLSDMTSK